MIKRIIKGDVVRVKKGVEIDWIEKPNLIIVEDIYEVNPNSNWVVIKINGLYKDSTGKECDTILLENVRKDQYATREKLLSSLIDSAE